MRTQPRRSLADLDQLRLGVAGDRPAAAGPAPGAAVREAFARVLGSRRAPAVEPAPIAVACVDTPIGFMLAGGEGDSLRLLEFIDPRDLDEHVARLERRLRRALVPGRSAAVERVQDELARYFAGTLDEFTVPLRPAGTPFEERVWRELLRIPYGRTRSYEELALALRLPNGQRAVGGANGRNPIAIVVPCHRVVNKGGGLGGYGGGLWRKEALLRLERTRQPIAAMDR
jgi:AraC family transcriptional regulator of adaptative response/methylated-DNA-[protein]-cysteine methyltransferase